MPSSEKLAKDGAYSCMKEYASWEESKESFEEKLKEALSDRMPVRFRNLLGEIAQQSMWHHHQRKLCIASLPHMPEYPARMDGVLESLKGISALIRDWCQSEGFEVSIEFCEANGDTPEAFCLMISW